MTKRLGVWLLMLCNVFIWAQNDETGRKKSAPDLNDHVEVVNIEMLARVQKNGQPAGGLQKSDFILEENGHPVEINGFREERRRIRPAPVAGNPVGTVGAPPSRLFVLYFWLWEPNAPYPEALDLFFKEIYRPTDRIFLVHDRGMCEIDSPEKVVTVRPQFESELKKRIMDGKNDRRNTLREVDDAISGYFNRGVNVTEEEARKKLQNNISMCWREFHMKYLQGQSGSLKRFAESLAPLNCEKWVLTFIQEELFPDFATNSSIPAVANPLDEMRKAMGDTRESFTEAVRSAFIAANATVSVIRCSGRAYVNDDSPYYRQRVVASDMEESFNRISRITGGATITDDNLARALSQAADKEDICYFISYVPTEGGKKREIQLTCRDKALEVFASRHNSSSDPRQLTISAASVYNSRLRFSLSGYTRLFEDGRLQGRVLVRVFAKGSGSFQTASEREFTLLDPAVQIPVALRLPRGRKYEFEIRVLDHISGRESVKQVALRNM
jgi:hypothetical protein